MTCPHYRTLLGCDCRHCAGTCLCTEERASDSTFWCGNCLTECSENYCPTCGQTLKTTAPVSIPSEDPLTGALEVRV